MGDEKYRQSVQTILLSVMVKKKNRNAAVAKDVQGENCLFLTRVYVCAQLLGFFNFGGLLNHKGSLFTLDIISLSDI